MRLKSELYQKEQEEIVDKIIAILELDKDNSITSYELDNDSEKIKKIMELSGKIRTYFAYRCITGVREPEKIKRPWLSIIKHITKLKYKMIISDFGLRINDKVIRTKKYHFILKN